METAPETIFPATAASFDESPTLAKLAEALAKAQGAMKAAERASENPDFQSRYADLASVWAACREPLAANGLSVVQRPTVTEHGVQLTTLLLHSSGEWIRDRIELPVTQRTAQAYGSAITYARRYALAALVGVAAGEDDDGAAASADPRAKPRQQPAARRAEKEQPQAKPAVAQSARERGWALWMDAKKKGVAKDGFLTWATEVLGVTKDMKEWTLEEVESLEQAYRNRNQADAA